MYRQGFIDVRGSETVGEPRIEDEHSRWTLLRKDVVDKHVARNKEPSGIGPEYNTVFVSQAEMSIILRQSISVSWRLRLLRVSRFDSTTFLFESTSDRSRIVA